MALFIRKDVRLEGKDFKKTSAFKSDSQRASQDASAIESAAAVKIVAPFG